MKKQKFPELFRKYMLQKKAKVETMVEALNSKGFQISRQTIFNWKKGKYKPRSRESVLACANYLRLSRKETNQLLVAADLPEEEAFVKHIFMVLPRYRVILLLTQADWGEPPYHEYFKTLLAYADRIYRKNNVLHINVQRPAAPDGDINSDFSILGQQCGFSDVDDVDSFEYALETKLEQTEQLFLLVSHFEQGAELLRQQLASIIRGVGATASHFHVILCGGEKLADLRYKYGASSLLSHATVEYWPELSRPDVYTLSNHYFKEVPLDLDEALVDQFLAISGAHPKLLTECLKLKTQSPDLPLEKYPEKLSQCDWISELFTAFTQNESVRQRVSEWLQKDEVGNAEPYILDNLRRQLYWKNLLVEREVNEKKRLYWRCEAMRMAGQQMFINLQ
jgi:hypothetical protein